MGIFAVRYSGITDDDPAHGPEGDVVVTDHAQLPHAARRRRRPEPAPAAGAPGAPQPVGTV